MSDVDDEPLENLPALNDIIPETEMSAHAQKILAYARRQSTKGISKAQMQRDIVKQFQQVFQMIGGLPRFALWADQNPDAFYQHYSKLLPATLRQEHLQDSNTDPGALTLEELCARVQRRLAAPLPPTDPDPDTPIQ